VEGQKGQKEIKSCIVEGLEIKEENGNAYSKGYIATTHADRIKDIFSKSVLDKWANQINDPKGEYADAYAASIHHDRDDKVIAGAAVKAEVKPMDNGEYGLWVETMHNKEHPKYDNLNYEVENKMISGYSVEFKTDAEHPIIRNGEEFRVIDDATLRGYGFAGPRTIVNPEAKIVDYAIKELVSFEEPKEDKMNVKEEETKPVDVPEEETKTEEQPKEEVEEKVDEETTEGDNEEEKEFKKWKQMKEDLKFKEKIKSVFEELNKKEKPLVNPGEQIEAKEELEVKEITNFHKAIETKDTSLMFKEAGKLLGRYPSIFTRSANSMRDILEIKEAGMEYKALTKTTNEASQYYQAVAELNDVYDPIIVTLLNDRTTTWGILPKDDYSGKQMIQWRVITSGITAEGYPESDGTWTSTQVTRKKMEQDFCNYRAIVEVTGQMRASAAGGGIGDVFSQEVERAGIDLRKQLNEDLLTGSGGTYDGSDDSHLIGFQHLILDTGTIYGRNRSGATYIQGTDEAMGDKELTLTQMRKMIRTVMIAGADRNDLVFVTSYALSDKYRAIMQGMSVQVPDSKRAGFEGLPALDGVPILADAQADADDMFLINIGPNGIRVGIQVAPTLTEFGVTGDTRKAFIKTYFQTYCKDLRLNYWSSGFATS